MNEAGNKCTYFIVTHPQMKIATSSVDFLFFRLSLQQQGSVFFFCKVDKEDGMRELPHTGEYLLKKVT